MLTAIAFYIVVSKNASTLCLKIRTFIEKKTMSLVLTNKTIDKYFGFLSRLDNRSKKKLIIKLTESIEEKATDDFNLKSLYGAWEDSRDSDDIIREIRDSRVDKSNNIEF
jgi:hypothetical protein